MQEHIHSQGASSTSAPGVQHDMELPHWRLLMHPTILDEVRQSPQWRLLANLLQQQRKPNVNWRQILSAHTTSPPGQPIHLGGPVHSLRACGLDHVRQGPLTDLFHVAGAAQCVRQE